MNGERYQHLSHPRHCLDRYQSFVRKTHPSDRYVVAMLMMRNPWWLEGSKCLPSPRSLLLPPPPSLPTRAQKPTEQQLDRGLLAPNVVMILAAAASDKVRREGRQSSAPPIVRNSFVAS